MADESTVNRGFWPVARHAILVVLVVAAAVAFFIAWERLSRRAPAAAAGPAAAPLSVSVIEATEQSVPLSPSYLGRTEASQTVEIRARVNGFLEERAFEEGAVVKAGQMLFRIDPKPLEASLAVAKARAASAQARLEEAQRQLLRLDQAAAGGATTPLEYDQAQTDERVAAADLRFAQATVVQAELDLGYTRVTSPIDGVIGLSLKDPGTYVEAGASGLLTTIHQLDPLYVTFSVSEQELLRWQRLRAAGLVAIPDTDHIPLLLQLADGSVYTGPAPDGGRRPIEGRINFISTDIDPTTATALVRGVFDNPDGLLKPGQFVRVTSRGISRLHAILVPHRAVLQSPAGASLYVAVEEDGQTRAAARAVTLGEWYQDSWIVTEGLRPGDRVIVDRLMQIRPGAAIAPTLIPAPSVEPVRGPEPGSHP